jgi:hypothetical protein
MHKAADPVTVGGFKKYLGAEYVRTDKRGGADDRPVHVRFRGEVNDRVLPGDHVVDEHWVASVALHEPVTGMPAHRLQIREVAGIGQLVEDSNVTVGQARQPAFQRRADELGPDESGAPGNQNPHVVIPIVGRQPMPGEGCQLYPGLLAGDTLTESRPGGWFWGIPLSNGTVSVGYVTPVDEFKKTGLSLPELFADQLAKSEEARKLTDGATQVTGFRSIKDWSYTCTRFHGPGWALVGDAAAFIDPLLSTGVTLALRGAKGLADAVDAAAHAEPDTAEELLDQYETSYRDFLDTLLDFIRYFYDRDRTKEEYWDMAQRSIDPDHLHAPVMDFATMLSGLTGLTEIFPASAAGRTRAAQIAAAADADAAALERLLRFLTLRGLLYRDETGGYALTELGEGLRDDHPAGVRAWLDIEGAGRPELAFVQLLHSIRTGQAAFPQQFGRTLWDDLAASEQRALSSTRRWGRTRRAAASGSPAPTTGVRAVMWSTSAAGTGRC